MSLGCLSDSKRSNRFDGHLRWNVLCCTYVLSILYVVGNAFAPGMWWWKC